MDKQNDYQSQSEDNGSITADNLMAGGHQRDQWQEYRNKLEKALGKDAPTLEMTIQSSATLIKGEKIQVNALGLVSHESKRTNPETPINAP